MVETGELLFPAINVNDSVTKSKFDNLYGCRHSLIDGINRATDVMIGGKVAVVCGFGDVGKGCAESLRGQGARVVDHRDRPDLRAAGGDAGLRGQDARGRHRHAPTSSSPTTGNKDIITRRAHGAHEAPGDRRQHRPLRQRDRHRRPRPRSPGIERVNIKPQVDKWVFPDGHAIIMLSEGRLLNLGNATGHPSFVMSNSFSNQTIAQIELFTKNDEYEKRVYVLPKHLDEKVARLHLDALGVKLTKLSRRAGRLHRRARRGAVQARPLPLLVAGTRPHATRDESDGPRGGPRHAPAPADVRDHQADGAGARPAGDGAHPRPARPPRLRGGDRQPALLPGVDPRVLRRAALPTASRRSCSGTAGRGARVRGVLRRRALPGDLRRRAHRHRPDARFAARHREAGGIATLAVKKVADTREYGVVLHDREGRITGFQEKPAPEEALSDLGNCGIYVFEPEIFDYFPEPPVRGLGAGRVPGAARERRAVPHPRGATSTGTTSARSASCARAPSTRCAASCTWRSRARRCARA